MRKTVFHAFQLKLSEHLTSLRKLCRNGRKIKKHINLLLFSLERKKINKIWKVPYKY